MSDRLYRSRDDRILTGVAGGVAEQLDADPSLIRIVWAVLIVLTGGLALLVYIVMAVVVPERGRPGRSPGTGRHRPNPRRMERGGAPDGSTVPLGSRPAAGRSER